VLAGCLEVCDAHKLEVGQVDKAEEVVENKVEHIPQVGDGIVGLCSEVLGWSYNLGSELGLAVDIELQHIFS